MNYFFSLAIFREIEGEKKEKEKTILYFCIITYYKRLTDKCRYIGTVFTDELHNTADVKIADGLIYLHHPQIHICITFLAKCHFSAKAMVRKKIC